MPAKTMEEAVANGARILESVEGKIEKAHRQMLDMLTVLDDGRALGMIPSALKFGLLKGEVMEAAGMLGHAYRLVQKFHREVTDVAIENGVDVPQPRDGGSR